MEMDMDVPLPEELEWLEANSYLHEDFEDLDPPEPYPDDDDEHHHQHQQRQNPQYHPPKPPHSVSFTPAPIDPPPQSPPSGVQIGGLKRLRPESNQSSSAGEKRIRSDDPAEPEVIEDWLRYSPPPKEIGPAAEVEMAAEDETILSRYSSEIDGDWVPVTGPSGDRVYAKIGRMEREGAAKKLDSHGQSSGLVMEPINDLLQKVEHDSFMKALGASFEGRNDEVIPESAVLHERLWVDKYAPNSFTELLSDEHTNREVLLWLKQWDSRVFGDEIRSTTEDVLSALRRHSSVAQHKKFSDQGFPRKDGNFKFSKEPFQQSDALDWENNFSKGAQDRWNRNSKSSEPPEHKVLLLCGPPGLGKTTLAHVAAKHCGYRVVEINASDDRSSSTIESKILDVVQMNSVMADSKPKCLVIDEIDGALGDGKGAVEVILKMLSSERKSDAEKGNVTNEGQSGGISSKKWHKPSSLSRPVICICNDLYAPALRPLRQVAKVHVFVKPTMSRIVSRLKYICHKESLKVSSIALTALADCTECDVRSCLNTLQFLKKKGSLNVMEISSQVVGQKDVSRSAFDIWKEIFQKRKKKQERKSDNTNSRLSSGFDFLYSLISNCGEYDLIMDGIHENFLQLQYLDPLMQKTINCMNNLGVSDLVHQYTMRTQNMSLNVYQPPIAIAVHSLIARVERPIIEWPKSFHRNRAILMEKKDILRSWHSKIKPDISRHLSIRSFVEDLVSPLLHILSPPTLRPVALSEREKNKLAQLVNMMVSYSITYKNIKSDSPFSNQINGAALDSSMVTLSLEPPIADFIKFKGFKSDHAALTLAMKQVLVHEVEKQRILQRGMDRPMHPLHECNNTAKGSSGVLSSKIDCAPAYDENVKNARDKLSQSKCKPRPSTDSLTAESSGVGTTMVKPKSSGDVKKPPRGFNFFGRFKKLSSKDSQNDEVAIQNSVTSEGDSHPLIFKYNEGFTNAVKKPVRMRDFLL